MSDRDQTKTTFKIARRYQLGFLIYLISLLGTGSVSAQNPVPAYYSLFYADGPIIIRGAQIPQLDFQYPIDRLRIMVVSRFNTLTTIPYQIDEIGQFERYIHDVGISGKEKPEDHLVFDKNDELCFLTADTTPVSLNSKTALPPNHKILYQFNLRDQKKKINRFAYLVLADKPLATKQKTAVQFYPDKQQVQSEYYQFFYDADRILHIKEINIKGPHESKFKPFFKESTFNLLINLKYFLSMTFDENRIVSKLTGYRNGPIRLLARVSFSFDLYFFSLSLNLVSEMTFFNNAIIIPAILNLPKSPIKQVNYGSGLLMGFQFNPEEQTTFMGSNINKMRQHQAVKSDKSTRKATFTEYPVLQLALKQADQFSLIEFHGKNSLPNIENQLFYTLKQGPQGPQTGLLAWAWEKNFNLGFYFEGSQLKKGHYFLDIHLTVGEPNHTNLIGRDPLLLWIQPVRQASPRKFIFEPVYK